MLDRTRVDLFRRQLDLFPVDRVDRSALLRDLETADSFRPAHRHLRRARRPRSASEVRHQAGRLLRRAALASMLGGGAAGALVGLAAAGWVGAAVGIAVAGPLSMGLGFVLGVTGNVLESSGRPPLDRAERRNLAHLEDAIRRLEAGPPQAPALRTTPPDPLFGPRGLEHPVLLPPSDPRCTRPAPTAAERLHTVDDRGRLVAVEPHFGLPLWRVTVPTPAGPPVVVSERTVVAWSQAGTLTALDAAEGRFLWTAETGPPAAPPVAGPDGSLLVCNQRGAVLQVDAAEGRVAGRVDLPAPAPEACPFLPTAEAWAEEGGWILREADPGRAFWIAPASEPPAGRITGGEDTVLVGGVRLDVRPARPG